MLAAGGCFWGTELAFQRVPGVAKTFAGYTQGQQKGPTYESVCSGRSGHTEAILVSLSRFSLNHWPGPPARRRLGAGEGGRDMLR